MNFTRNSYINGTENTGPREYINSITSYLDCSFLYGSDITTSNTTRLFVNGQIHSDWNKLVVPNMVGPQLLALSQVFALEHNRLANQFAIDHPEWDDETLFQEARR